MCAKPASVAWNWNKYVSWVFLVSVCLSGCPSFLCAAAAAEEPYYLPEWASGNKGYDFLGSYGVKGEPSASNMPGGRVWAALWTDGAGNILLFGGSGWGETRYTGPVQGVSQNALGPLNDVWKYEAATGNWVWLEGDSYTWASGRYDSSTGTPLLPSARYGMAVWPEASGNAWFFGGWGWDAQCVCSFDYLSEVWKWDAAAGTWRLEGATGKEGVYGTRGVAAPENHAGARAHPMYWKSADGLYWLFGGAGYATDPDQYGRLNDLWKYDPAGKIWTWMHGTATLDAEGVYGVKGQPDPANMPGSRLGGASWVGKDGKFWLFGGGKESLINDVTDQRSTCNDLWQYDPATNVWTWVAGSDIADQPGVYGEMGVPAPANTPGARYDATTWTDAEGNLWLFGGVGVPTLSDGSTVLATLSFSDLWKFDPGVGMWTWMQGSKTCGERSVYGTRGEPAATNRVGARQGATAVARSNGNVWIFGGATYPNLFNYATFDDVWVLHPQLENPVLAAFGIKANSFSLSWAAVPHAAYYKLTVARDNGFTDILPGYNDREVTGTSVVVEGLARTTAYYSRAKAGNAVREGSYSATLRVVTTPHATPCNPLLLLRDND